MIPFVEITRLCAAILFSDVFIAGGTARLPSEISVAVESIPVFVVSACVQPVKYVARFVALASPAITKVRLGSIVARTVTDSTTAKPRVELSRMTEPASLVCTPTFHTSD